MRRIPYLAITIISLIASLIAWRTGAQEQTAASAQRTTLARARAVIAEELGKSGTDVMSDVGVNMRVSLTSLKGCKMQYRKSSTNGRATDYRVSLTNLDPESVSVGDGGRLVAFTIAGGAKKIYVTPIPGIDVGAASAGGREGEHLPGGYAAMLAGDSLRVSSQESASRLQSALVEAVKACQPQL